MKHDSGLRTIDLTPLHREGIRTATVLRPLDGRSVEIAMDGRALPARLTRAARDARAGDSVLVVSGLEGAFVIGILVEEGDEVAYARLERDGATGRSVLRLPEGAIEVRATGELTFAAEGPVRIESRERVTLSAGEDAATDAAMTVDRDRVHVRSAAVDVDASALEVGARRAVLIAESVAITADVARRTLGTLETDVERIVERAHTVVREARDLALTRAGRLRTVVERAASFLAERVVVNAERDVKIDGSRIHLG